MTFIVHNEKTLQTYIINQCKNKLKSTANDVEIDIAIKYQLVTKSAEWNKLSAAVIKDNFDTNEEIISGSEKALELDFIQQNLDQFVSSTVDGIKKAQILKTQKRSTPERLISDYFFPALHKEKTASSEMLSIINKKLTASTDSDDTAELTQYQTLLSKHIAYLETATYLPAHLEKLVAALCENTGKNYTPRQNAQVVTALLDTLRKANEGNWTIDKLLGVVKLVTKVSMPDLPVNACTLNCILELLPVVNQLIENNNAFEQEKSKLFVKEEQVQTAARKALFDSMNVSLSSLSSLCQETLWKPVEDLMKSTGELGAAAGLMSSEDGFDTIHFMRVLDKAGDVINGLPVEMLPKSVQKYATQYVNATQAVSHVISGTGKVVNIAGQVVGAVGSATIDTALKYTSNNVKHKIDEAVNSVAGAVIQAAPTVGTGLSFINYLTPPHYTPFTSAPLALLMRKASVDTATSMVMDTFSYFIPTYIKNKFKKADTESEFWQEVMPAEGGIDPNTAAAYFHFYELAKTSDTLVLEQEFFQSVMKKAGINSDYSDYVDFKNALNIKALNSPLKTLLEDFQATTGEKRLNNTFYMLQKIKSGERECKQSGNFVPFLKELDEAVKFASVDPLVAGIQQIYLKPVMEKILLECQQSNFMVQLEKALDLADNVNLRVIYSKLKAGQLLMKEDLNFLQHYSNAEISALNDEINILSAFYAPTQNKEVSKALTPTEEARQSMQANLDSIYPVCMHISEGLEKQLKSCIDLQELSLNDPLKGLCTAKIKYLKTIQAGLKQFMQDIKAEDQGLAEHLRKIASGEIINDVLNAESTTIVKQLIGLSWEYMGSASISEQILTYALGNSGYLNGITTEKYKYDEIVKQTPPPPELMAQLGNPLHAVTGLNEHVVLEAVSGALKSGQSIVEPLVSYYMMSSALSLAFPPGLIFDITAGVLARNSVKQKISDYLGPVSSIYQSITGVLSEATSYQVEKLAEPIKDLICPILNVEVQKILEEKAFAYAFAKTADRSKLNKSERDAFSGFYLQYCAIKNNNPDVNKIACIEYLFKQSLLTESNLEKRATIVKQLSEEFKKLDNAFEKDKTDSSTSELETELQFLMDKIDFDKPDEIHLVAMTIYNQLILKQFEASKQLSVKQSTQLHQKAMDTINLVLKSLQKADAYKSSDDIRVHARAEQLAPATKVAVKIKLTQLQKELLNVTKLVSDSISDREDQLKADQNPDEPSRLGEHPFVAAFAKYTLLGLLVKGFRKIVDLVTNIINFVTETKETEAKQLSKNILITKIEKSVFGKIAKGIYKLLVAPLSIITDALSVFAQIAGGGVYYKAVQEIGARSDQFQAITDSNASWLDKWSLKILLGIKCLGIAFLNTVVPKFVYSPYDKIVKPIIETVRGIDDFGRFHPEAQVLEAEKQSLTKVHEQLIELKNLIDEQIEDQESINFDFKKPDPAQFNLQSSYDERLAVYTRIMQRAVTIENSSKILSRSLRSTQNFLIVSSIEDARWKQGENKELATNKAEFAQLVKTMKDVNSANNLVQKMQPQMTIQEKNANSYAKSAQVHLEIAKETVQKVKKEQHLFSTDLRNDEVKLKEMAGRLHQTLDEITVNTQNAQEHYENAYQEAKNSGEVGYLSTVTSITGPTLTASNKAQKAWESTKELKNESKQFLKTVEVQIAQLVHTTVMEHTTEAHKILAKLSNASKLEQIEHSNFEELMDDFENEDVDLDDLDYEYIEERIIHLQAVISRTEKAVCEVDKLCQKAFKAMKEAEVGLSVSTKEVYDTARVALNEAREEENKAQQLLQKAIEVLAEIGDQQKAETQFEKIENTFERINTLQNKFNTEKLKQEVVDKLLEEANEELDFLCDVTSKLKTLYQIVSADPKNQDVSVIEEALEAALKLENQAKQWLIAAKPEEHLSDCTIKVSGLSMFKPKLAKHKPEMVGLTAGEDHDITHAQLAP